MSESVEIRLPQFGMGMLEGTILRWMVQAGDEITVDQVIAEVEAAKTTEELRSPVGGVVERIVIGEGETVPVNELLAVIVPVGAATDASTASAAPSASVPPVSRAMPDSAPATERDRRRPAGLRRSRGPAVSTASGGRGPGRIVTPRARRLARDHGIDLDSLTGSGPGGRITEEDVQNAVSAAVPTASPAVDPAVADAAPAAAMEAGPAPETASAPAETVAMRGMRATIAQRMLHSMQSTAQFTLMTTADVTELVGLRAAMAEPRPSYTDFILRAVAQALRDHPRLNAALIESEIHMQREMHIGVATALEEGLVAAVVRDADQKSLRQIARESAELIERIRSGSFTVDDVSGSTFTVTSLGGQGIDGFTPILNPPEAAILGVGRIVDRPTRGPQDELIWRKSITLSLTVDHRIIDGAPGAAFLRTLTDLLASPILLFE